MLSAQSPVLFSPKLCSLNCALVCDSSLLFVSAKDKKVFSYFEIVNVKLKKLVPATRLQMNK